MLKVISSNSNLSNEVFYIISLQGTSQLSLATLAYLEPFQRITFWFDQSVIVWDLCRIFAKKIGEDRCYFIRFALSS